MPIECPNCLASNHDGEPTCSLCGEELKEVTVTDPKGPPEGERTGSFEADIRGIVIGGTVAGRYLVKEMLGRGGVAMVFRASDNTLGGEEIALKVFPNLTRQEAADVERFKREVLVNRRISHVNVIRVYDFGTVGDDGYLTMELLTGGTLAEKIEAKPLPIAEAVEIAIGVSEGLQAAHTSGIVHRDVKPENVLFDTTGRPKLTDFGLARLMDASTHTKGFSGTPFYMSPEQAEGGEITAQTDVYSLGVLLFELFTGQLPFFADSLLRIAMLHANEIPPMPSSLRPGLPEALEQLVLACLAKSPDARPQGVGAVAASLRKFRRDGGLDQARGLDSDPSFSTHRRRARLPSEKTRLADRASVDAIAAPAADRETVIVKVDRDGSSAPRPHPRDTLPPELAPLPVSRPPPREQSGARPAVPPPPPREHSGARPAVPAPPLREQSGARPAVPSPPPPAPAVPAPPRGMRERDLVELPMPAARRFPVPPWLLGALFAGSVGGAAFFGGPWLREFLDSTPTPVTVVLSPTSTPTPTPTPTRAVASPTAEKPTPTATRMALVSPSPSATPTATKVAVAPSPTPTPREEFGAIKLRLDPWGIVTLDDVKQASTTDNQDLYDLTTRSGRRVLRVVNPVLGYDQEVSVRVKPGKPCVFPVIHLQQRAKLRPPPGCE